MFDIEYKGGNGVVISTKNLKLVADPKLSLIGLKDLSVKESLEIATEPRFLSGADDSRLTIEGPGEYEIGDFSIRGIGAVRHLDAGSTTLGTTMYRISIGDIKVALIGNIGASLNEDQLEAIGVVDIVIIPVGGGGYALDGVNASKLVRQIDPKVVIPVHYADGGLKYEVPQDELKLFTDELGVTIESVDKYKIKTAPSLPATLTVVEVRRS